MHAYKNFFVSPQENEVIKTVVTQSKSEKPALIGSVYDDLQKPVENAFIAVFEVLKKDHNTQNLTAVTYTDEFGSFIIAPLEADKLYNVKIYKNFGKSRTLETE